MKMSSYRNPKIYVTTPPPTPYDSYLKRRRIAALIFVIVFAIGFFWLLFFSPVFAVTDILVEGAVPEEVRPKFEQFKGRNIWRLDALRLENELKAEYAHIKSVSIYRGLPNVLKIVVNPRQEKMVWQSGDSFYLVDDDGIAFQGTGEPAASLPLVIDSQALPVTVGRPLAADRFVAFVTDIAANLESVTGLKLKETVVRETTFQIEAVTDRPYVVIFDTTRKSEPQLKALARLLAGYEGQIGEYIDLRVAGKAYVK